MALDSVGIQARSASKWIFITRRSTCWRCVLVLAASGDVTSPASGRSDRRDEFGIGKSEFGRTMNIEHLTSNIEVVALGGRERAGRGGADSGNLAVFG